MGKNMIMQSRSLIWLDHKTREQLEKTVAMLIQQHEGLLAIILYGSIAQHVDGPLPLPFRRLLAPV